MPDRLRTGIERLSGFSLDDVRVHYNSPDPTRIGAQAYARGSNIHIAPGQERHLGHEAWHVVQQKQGRVRPTLQAKGLPINDDGALEREADAMGARAVQAPPHDVPARPLVTKASRGGVAQLMTEEEEKAAAAATASASTPPAADGGGSAGSGTKHPQRVLGVLKPGGGGRLALLRAEKARLDEEARMKAAAGSNAPDGAEASAAVATTASTPSVDAKTPAVHISSHMGAAAAAASVTGKSAPTGKPMVSANKAGDGGGAAAAAAASAAPKLTPADRHARKFSPAELEACVSASEAVIGSDDDGDNTIVPFLGQKKNINFLAAFLYHSNKSWSAEINNAWILSCATNGVVTKIHVSSKKHRDKMNALGKNLSSAMKAKTLLEKKWRIHKRNRGRDVYSSESRMGVGPDIEHFQ